jgi:hypothetical protein
MTGRLTDYLVQLLTRINEWSTTDYALFYLLFNELVNQFRVLVLIIN